MVRNALILILIAGLCLAVITLAQTPPTMGNETSTLIVGDNMTITPDNLTPASQSQESYVQGELLVRFNPVAFPNPNALNAISMQTHASIGAVLIDEYKDIPGLELIRLPPGMTVQDGIAYYQGIPTVMYAEKNAIYSISNATVQGNLSTYPQPAGNTTETGDLFVKYNATAFLSPSDLQIFANTTNAGINASLVTDYTMYGMPGLQLVSLEQNMTNAQGIAYYQNVTNVVYAEPNVRYQAVIGNQTLNTTPEK